MAEVQKSTVDQTRPAEASQESPWKHVLFFLVMIVLTAAAFVFVGYGMMPTSVLIPVILILASVQVVIQLFTFMHLNQKGSFFPILFMGGGIVVAATAIIAMVFWV